MPEDTGSTSPPAQGGAAGQQQAAQITPEMVKTIADKVFNMLLLELKYDYERHRFSSHRPVKTKGVR